MTTPHVTICESSAETERPLLEIKDPRVGR